MSAFEYYFSEIIFEIISAQIVITSMLVCEQHYDGAKHNRKIAVELEKFHQARRKFDFLLAICASFFPF